MRTNEEWAWANAQDEAAARKQAIWASFDKAIGKYHGEDGDKMATNMTDKIKQWAVDRNLHTANPDKQMLKLYEELGELASGMAKGKPDLVADSIGDAYVVLTILSMQLGIDIEECIALAYDEIKDRKGRMIDGVFVKESDL